jgi:hypothetical protein
MTAADAATYHRPGGKAKGSVEAARPDWGGTMVKSVVKAVGDTGETVLPVPWAIIYMVTICHP